MISYHTAIPPTPLHLTKTDTDGEVVLTIASMMKPPVFTSPPDMHHVYFRLRQQYRNRVGPIMGAGGLGQNQ
jgi:hypothetical protein